MDSFEVADGLTEVHRLLWDVSAPAIPQLLVDRLPHEFWIMDADGRYVLQNGASRRAWGNLVGRFLHTVDAPASDLARWQENDDRTLAGESVVSRFERRGGSRPSRCLCLLTPLRVGADVRGIVGMNLNEPPALATAADAVRGAPSADIRSTALATQGIAHDLNNVLMVIGAAAELAAGEPDSSQTRDHLRIIEAAASQCGRLAKQLIQGDDDATVAMPLDISSCVLGLVERVRATLPDGALLEARVDPDVFVCAEAGHVDRVLSNLILNAVQSLRDRPGRVRVLVSAAPRDAAVANHLRGMARLSVEDDGCGIASGQLLRIFEPYSTTKPDGKGLGLWIVRHLVDLLGGDLRVSSRSGSGTRFDILLPLAPSS